MGLKEYIAESKIKEDINPNELVEQVKKHMKASGLKENLTVTTVYFEGKTDIKKICESLNKKLGSGIVSENEVIYDGGGNYNIKIKKENNKIKARIARSGC